MYNYKYKIANSSQEIESCQALLRAVFNEEEGFDLVIPDQFESRSVYYYAHFNSEVVACLRFIQAVPGKPSLPLHVVAPDVRFDPRYTHAEVSRWVVAAEHRGRITSREVYRKCWEVAAELGYDYVVSEAKYKALALHKRIGFQEFSAPFHDPDMHAEGDAPGLANAVIMRANVDTLIAKHGGKIQRAPKRKVAQAV